MLYVVAAVPRTARIIQETLGNLDGAGKSARIIKTLNHTMNEDGLVLFTEFLLEVDGELGDYKPAGVIYVSQVVSTGGKRANK